MNLATQRDNSPIIANAILNKNPISTKSGAQVVNISIDLSGYVATLKTALENALRQHFTGLSVARRALVDEMDTVWDPQSNTLKTKIQIDAPNENAMTAIKDSIEDIRNNGITFEPNMSVPDAGPPAPPVPGVDGYTHHDPRVRYQSCIQANQEDIRRGQYKLSSAIDLILDAKTLTSLNAHIDIMSNQNDWNPDEAGELKWARLEHLFDGKGKSTLNQIMKYVNFMKRQRKADESLSEYVAALRSAVVRLKRKNWSLNEIIAVLCYADILMSKDKTSRGIELDYSELKNDLRNSFKADKFITPSQIELKLEEISEEAKGGNELAVQSGKAFVGRKRKADAIDDNSGDSTNDSHKALKAQIASLNNKINQMKKGKNNYKPNSEKQAEGSTYTDPMGRERVRVVKFSKGKLKGQWSRYQPPKMPGHKQFSKTCRFCWECKKRDEAEGLPADGWSDKSVNGRVAHTTDQHKLVFNE